MRFTTALLLLCSTFAFSQEILRVPPSKFPQLPQTIRQELTRRGCTIPQIPNEKIPHNVIKGSFLQRSEPNWAVLCSINGTSSILVFKKAAAKQVIELAPQPDANSIQSDANAQLVYSRKISPAKWRGHQGIEDAFVGKASVVWYFHQGKWLIVAGAD